MDQLEALLAQRVKMREDAGKPLTEEQIQQVREQLQELLSDKIDKVGKMKEALEAGAGDELTLMNSALGLPGALALFDSILNACGLTAKRKDHYRKKLTLPEGLRKEPIATMKIEFANFEGHFLLHGGRAGSDHDLEGEFAKLPEGTRAEDVQTIKDQMGFLVYFTRGVFIRLLDLNEHILQDLSAKMEGINPRELGLDESNSTLYLIRRGPEEAHEKLGPRFGLFLTKKE